MRFLLAFMFLLVAAAPVMAEQTGMVAERGTTLSSTVAMPSAGIFMLITNETGKDDELVDIESDIAGQGMLHDTEFDKQGVMMMRHTDAVAVPAGKTIALTPVGTHAMLMKMSKALREGETFPVTLVFKNAGKVQANIEAVSPDELTERFPPELMSADLQRMREAQIAKDTAEKKTWSDKVRGRIRALLGKEAVEEPVRPQVPKTEIIPDDQLPPIPEGPVSHPVGSVLDDHDGMETP